MKKLTKLALTASMLSVLLGVSGCNLEERRVAKNPNACISNGGIVKAEKNRDQSVILYMCKDGSVRWGP